jgi:hypothetical protein
METGAFSGSRPIVRKDWISRLSVFVHCPIAREEPSVGYDFENNAAEGKYINSIVVSSSIENLGSPIALRASQELRGDQTLDVARDADPKSVNFQQSSRSEKSTGSN